MLFFKLISPFVFIAMRILSVIVYIFTLLAAFGGKINPNFLTFPAVLSLAFPYLAILSILLIIFWIVCKKIIFSAFGIMTIILCLTPLSTVFPLGSSREAGEKGRIFKVISWNVLHTQDIRQPDYPGNRAIEYIINSGADIVCLTELKALNNKEIHNFSKALQDSLFTLYPYHDGLKTTDIKVLSKYPVSRIDKSQYNKAVKSGFDFFKIEFPEGQELIVGMVHLYSFGLSEEERMLVTDINSVESAKSSVKEFRGPVRKKLGEAFKQRANEALKLRETLDDISLDLPLIVCGDFNDVPTSWTYNIIRGDEMHDAYSETNFGPAVTYNLHAFYFHIDQMLYRGPLVALDLTVGKINSSDHYPLIGEFQFM